MQEFEGGRARHIGGGVYSSLRGQHSGAGGQKSCAGGAESWTRKTGTRVNWWRAEMPTTDELEWCAET